MSDDQDHSLDDADETLPDVAEDISEVICPYCGELVEIALDAGGGAHQEYVEDCHVCCRPWKVRVNYGRDGVANVTVEADDDEDLSE